ncbi:ABC transporter substrate-binding protein [Palleronia sp. KMU-117]|uniref:ABC transporter substrate-binding protein n=1 Tax=Palleronia sp. KMU-117 TaxID=3434108 RepID=UPI003D727108
MSSKYLKLSTAAAAVAISSAASAQELTEVTFGTHWVAQAEHGGYYQAVVDGTYEACGLDVTILPGGPQVNNSAQLIAGRIQFYMGGTLGPLSAVNEGVPMLIVAASFQKEPQILMTHPGAISSFDEISTLDQLIIGDEGFVTYFKFFEKANGWDPAKRVPYTFNPAPFIANARAAQQGYVTSEPFAVEQEGGFKPDVWVLADNGYTAYSTTIVGMRDYIEANPEVVKCFVDGSAIGWANFLYGDNAAALAKIKEDNPDMSDDKLAFSIETMKQYGIVDSGDALTMGIGAMTDARMEDFFTKMVDVGVLPADLDYKQAYTLDFANSGASLEVKAALGQ